MADESVDLAVVGAGPAGLSAAVTAAELGASVALFDEQPAPGGQVWRGLERQGRGGDRAGHDLIARARTTAGIRLRPATTVFHAAFEGADGPTLSWMDSGGLGRTTARGLVLATGAMERPVPFPGWTLPGVLGVGALQAALKTGGLVPGSDGGGLVIAGRGPLVLLYLAQLAAAGGRATAVLELAGPERNVGRLASRLPGALFGDPATLGRGVWLLAARALRGVPVHRGVTTLRAEGDGRVEAVRFTDTGGERVLPCRLLAVHDGVIPNTQATRLLRLDHEWRDEAACFAPVTDDWGRATRAGKALGGAGVWVAGDGAGIEGARGAGSPAGWPGSTPRAASGGCRRRRSTPGPRRRCGRAPASRPCGASSTPWTRRSIPGPASPTPPWCAAAKRSPPAPSEPRSPAAPSGQTG